jgi:hypothetical protein
LTLRALRFVGKAADVLPAPPAASRSPVVFERYSSIK